MATVITFFAGVFCGGFIGIVVMAVLAAAGHDKAFRRGYVLGWNEGKNGKKKRYMMPDGESEALLIGR